MSVAASNPSLALLGLSKPTIQLPSTPTCRVLRLCTRLAPSDVVSQLCSDGRVFEESCARRRTVMLRWWRSSRSSCLIGGRSGSVVLRLHASQPSGIYCFNLDTSYMKDRIDRPSTNTCRRKMQVLIEDFILWLGRKSECSPRNMGGIGHL